MRIETLAVEESVGRILSHDITKIVKGQFKGAAFKRGHVIREEDIEELLRLGKEKVYVLELEQDEIHEDEAGVRLARAAAGSGVSWRGPRESRVNLHADIHGLLKINTGALEAINDLPDVIMSTLLNNTVVKPGDMLAGTKVIPLVVKESVIAGAEKIAGEAGVVKVVPFARKRAGIIVTGNEVYKGRITDAFGPVLSEKVKAYGSEVLEVTCTPDDAGVISETINSMLARGAGVILVSGGMSVDPDDITPLAIRRSGAEIIKYGAPALPGAMFLVAYLGEVPVLGVPACGMYFRTTVLDLLLPRIFAGERITARDIVKLAHGGLCRACQQCKYPNCSFGLGISQSGCENV